MLCTLAPAVAPHPPATCYTQGDIEAVASKSPQGLTTLFEQISGSEAFRARFDELQKEAAKAEEQVCEDRCASTIVAHKAYHEVWGCALHDELA